MSTTYVTTGFARPPRLLRRVFRLIVKYGDMFCEWQQRQALRGALYGRSDRDLQDIAITRGEIEYVARSRLVDPRGARST
jgi:uncharacterized protein YjiS (DUF1127 family)